MLRLEVEVGDLVVGKPSDLVIQHLNLFDLNVETGKFTSFVGQFSARSPCLVIGVFHRTYNTGPGETLLYVFVEGMFGWISYSGLKDILCHMPLVT
jgi:hypothetical protein